MEEGIARAVRILTLHRHQCKAKETWGDLTDDEMMQFRGKYDQAIGYLKEKYGDGAEAMQEWWDGRKT